MASRIAGITVEIGGDTTKLTKALQGVNKEISGTQTALKDVDKLLKLDPTNTELLTQKEKMLEQAIGATKDKLSTLQTAAQNSDLGAAEHDKLQREIIATEQELSKLEGELKSFDSVSTQQWKAMCTNIQEVGGKLKDLGSSITSVGTELTTKVTLPITALGTGVIKVSADFESAMSNVQALSGATGDDLELLESKAREMGSGTAYSATEAADAMGYMALAGWDAEQMAAGLEPILKLAGSAQMELAECSDIVTDNLTAFGLTANDTEHFTDVLATTMSKSNTDVSALGEAFKYCAPLAGSLGYSIDDVSLALGTMANAGIKGSSAGTALRTVLTNMANPTDDMAYAMTALGVSLTDEEGSMLSLREVMEQLRTGFGELKISEEEFTGTMADMDAALADGSMTQEEYDANLEKLMERAYGAEGAQKALYASMLAGKTGMSGLMAVVNASDSDWQTLADNIDNCDGSASDMYDTMQDNLSGQLAELKSALEELALEFGEILLPVVKDVVEFLQGLVEKFQGLSETQKTVIVVIAAIAAAIGPLLVIIGTVISIMGTLATVAGALGVSIGAICLPILAVIAAIAAVIAIGVLLYKNWDKICEWAGNTKEKVLEAWGQLKEKLSEWVNNLKEYMLERWKATKDGVINTVTTLKEGVINLWTKLKETVSNLVEGLKTAVSEKIEAVKTAVSEKFETIRSTIEDKITTAKTTVTDLFDKIKDGIKEKIESAKDTVDDIFGKIKGSIEDKISTAKETVFDIVDKIKGVFDFNWSLPDLALPHISVTGGEAPFGIGGKGSLPQFSIEWYKKAMDNATILKSPTIFGMSGGKMLGGGEAGNEVVSGEAHLISLIDGVVGNRVNSIESILATYLPKCAESMTISEVSNKVEQRITTNTSRRANAW